MISLAYVKIFSFALSRRFIENTRTYFYISKSIKRIHMGLSLSFSISGKTMLSHNVSLINSDLLIFRRKIKLKDLVTGQDEKENISLLRTVF